MRINELIDEALRNAETYTREEQEGYREVYISYEDVEKLAYDVAKQALYEFEDRLYDKMSNVEFNMMPCIFADTMEETQKEIGL